MLWQYLDQQCDNQASNGGQYSRRCAPSAPPIKAPLTKTWGTVRLPVTSYRASCTSCPSSAATLVRQCFNIALPMNGDGKSRLKPNKEAPLTQLVQLDELEVHLQVPEKALDLQIAAIKHMSSLQQTSPLCSCASTRQAV